MTANRMSICGLVALVLAGCTEQHSEPAPTVAAGKQASKPGFKHLRDFDVVSGVLPVRTSSPGKEALTLWAGGKQVGRAAAAPYRFSWDSAGFPDGLVQLTLRRGREEIDRARVVVLNRGSEVFFKNGSEGKIVVPPTGYQDQHLRYHWDMTGGARRLLAILIWDRPGFDLELAVGRGTCPHHGEQVAVRHAATSPLTVLHEAPRGQTLPTGQWFTHVRLMNADRVLGRETPFSVRAYVMR